MPLGTSCCSLSCFWGDANLLLLLLHAVAFFSPSAESQPAPLLVPHSQQLWGTLSPPQRASPDSERAVAKPTAAQQASPSTGWGLGGLALLLPLGEAGITISQAEQQQRESQPPLPRLSPAICGARCVTEPPAGCGS